jgi:hypothetical protein
MCDGRHSHRSQASYSIIAYASPLKGFQDAMNSHCMSSAAHFAVGRPRAGSELYPSAGLLSPCADHRTTACDASRSPCTGLRSHTCDPEALGVRDVSARHFSDRLDRGLWPCCGLRRAFTPSDPSSPACSHKADPCGRRTRAVAGPDRADLSCRKGRHHRCQSAEATLQLEARNGSGHPGCRHGNC